MRYPKRLRYWLLPVLMLFTLPLFAQTNDPTALDPATAPLPTDVGSFWKWGISFITPVIVWLVAKGVPKIPKMALPMLTPFIGIGLGLLMNKLKVLNLGWVDMAQAGALAVFIRETVNQAITKPIINKEGVATAGGTVLGLLLGCSLFITGCGLFKPVDKGANAFVVNVERTETIAKSTFDFVLRLDNTDRGFWRTNAPLFHNFCESLRQPQVVDGTNTLPRSSAILWSVDVVKEDYKASRATSNDLWAVFSTLNSALHQAQSWQNIITNTPRPKPQPVTAPMPSIP